MSKGNTVAKLLADQLEKENRRRPHNLNGKMGGHFLYTDVPNTIGNFLSRVRARLYKNVPIYYFQFDSKFSTEALNRTLGSLTTAVTRKTTTTKPPGWTNP